MRRWARIKHNVSKSANSGWLACVMRACGFVRRRRRKVQKAVCSHTNLVKSWALIYSISDAARCCYGSTAFFTPSHGAITGFRCVYVLFHFFFFVCAPDRARSLWLHARFGCWTDASWSFIWCMFNILHFYLPFDGCFFSRFVSHGKFRFPFFLFCTSPGCSFALAELMWFVCVIREQTYTNTKSGKVNLHAVINRIIHIVLTHYDCAPPSALVAFMALENIFWRLYFRPSYFFSSVCSSLHTYSCANADSRRKSNARRHTLTHSILSRISLFTFFKHLSSQFACAWDGVEVENHIFRVTKD